MTPEQQKEFEAFQEFKKQQSRPSPSNKPNSLGQYLEKVWSKYWKYLAIVAIAVFASTKLLFPYLQSIMPDKHLFDEGTFTQAIFSFIMNMCAFVYAIFISWLGFKTNDLFMGKSEEDRDGWAYKFDQLGSENGEKFNTGSLWQILISLFIFCFFYWAFLYGVGLPK